ncbi:biotin-independent malonate decarboxylase subunit beta [Bordetella genomosp. 10]|uniref:Biotin-independent malonate decarboxylase subunit beta n=1 Tax=Bordetella genomosp. 10 TaxID=1416804 RepID=A0A261S0Z2_9BORD|nr:biotin-independent malonate decarboxylase subunit beta [Bordetella genomosp. 10]OZI30811.1 biotin-independent malonate decarboxylase subunit beta [Bordetella genomosp. 10]
MSQHSTPALSWYESTARQRIEGLLDARSFVEFIGPEQRKMSPHLPMFDLPEAFDDGIVIGRGKLEGKEIFVAAQEGKFMGGAFGEVHGAKLLGLVQAAERHKRDLVICFDTGGVRLQEANAGEVAIAEIMRAIVHARLAGVQVVGLLGGRAGCYGGGSLIAGCCSALVISEHGRLSVSGPEVIETNHGVEEFDSKDRAFVWRTMGGKHRYLIGAVDGYAEDAIPAFRDAAISALGAPTALTLDTLRSEQTRLEQRLKRFGALTDGTQVWKALGIDDPQAIPSLPTDEFVALANGVRENTHGAR